MSFVVSCRSVFLLLTVVDEGFSGRGDATGCQPIILTNFTPKLRENEQILTDNRSCP